MIKGFLFSLLPLLGVGLIVVGLLITYSDRFYVYWYGRVRGDHFESGKSITQSKGYLLDRYWAGPHGVLGGIGLIIIYILYNERAARYLISFFGG